MGEGGGTSDEDFLTKPALGGGGGGGGGCDRYDGSFYFGGLVSFYKGSSPLIMFGY